MNNPMLIVTADGKAYALAAPKPFQPAFPIIDEPKRYTVPPIVYGTLPSAAAIMDDRTDDLLDLGRLILNGAELAKRRGEAAKRAES